MKDILDNWKQFINEEKSTFPKDSAQAKLANMTRKKRYPDASDEEWESLLEDMRNVFPTMVEEARERILNSFTSSVSKNAFVRLFTSKSDTEALPAKDLMLIYEKVVLVILKGALYERDIINSVAIDGPYKPQAPEHYRDIKVTIDHARKGEWLTGFAVVHDKAPNRVFINTPNTSREGLFRLLVHELAHIADYELIQNPWISELLSGASFPEVYDQGLFSALLKGEFKSLAKAYKDLPDVDKKRKLDKKGGAWYNWHKRPEEMYAVFKQIKTELFDRKEFFDAQGRIKLDYLKDYISDPKNKDRYVILKYLDIDKAEDIKKVFDQIVKVNNKMSRRSRIAEE